MSEEALVPEERLEIAREERAEERAHEQQQIYSLYGEHEEETPGLDEALPVQDEQPLAAQPEPTALWSNEDIGLITKVQSEYAAYQQDFADLQAARPELVEHIKRNPQDDQAVYLRFRDEEKDLETRLNGINEVATSLNGKIEAHNQRQLDAELASENEKLQNAMPGIDKPALGQYLLNLGYTAEQLSGANDHKLLVLAEKARLYDQQQPRSKTLTIPKARQERIRKTGLTGPGGIPLTSAHQGTTVMDKAQMLERMYPEGKRLVRGSGAGAKNAADILYPNG